MRPTLQRSHYMAGNCSHDAYYGSIAARLDISFSRKFTDRVKAALADGDEHLNSIPLREWDTMGREFIIAASGRQIWRDHGDIMSMAGIVSALKVAARQDWADGSIPWNGGDQS